MNAKTKSAIIRHGESLVAAFPNCTERDPVALCKKLRRIETSLTKPLTDYCNGTFQDDEEGTRLNEILYKGLIKAEALLGMDDRKQIETGIFINRDPRGCALKLDSEWVSIYNAEQYRAGVKSKPVQTDMGGYGILAPDLNR